MFDASGQFGNEYFCIREDRCRFPRLDAFDARARAQANLQTSFETGVCPLSTLGKGSASAEKKTINLASVYLMECDNRDTFNTTRCQVRGVVTDQGAERLVTDMPVRVIPGFENTYSSTDPQCFLFPWVLLGMYNSATFNGHVG